MAPIKRLLFRYVLPVVIVVLLAAGYEFFMGFPRFYDGKWVHRVTKFNPHNPFRREQIYYAYTSPDKRELNHGPFFTFSEMGTETFSAYYRDGKVDGVATWSNQFGEKSNEVFYRRGQAYGWARYVNGKLSDMKQDIFEDGRRVASRSFTGGKYVLNFNCGELIDATIDPVSGELTRVPGASKRACAPEDHN